MNFVIYIVVKNVRNRPNVYALWLKKWSHTCGRLVHMGLKIGTKKKKKTDCDALVATATAEWN